jgi:uncharacterized membrane protein YqjE
MQSVELVVICCVAFFMVFVILALLALMMRLIMLIFPQKKGVSDAAMIAAIAATVQTIFPGTKLTKVEERK